MVGVDGRLVYESLVCPENDIIDFNTRYSGISAKDFGNNPPFHDQNHRRRLITRQIVATQVVWPVNGWYRLIDLLSPTITKDQQN